MKRIPAAVVLLLALAPLYLLRTSILGIPTTGFELLLYGVAIGTIIPGSRAGFSFRRIRDRLGWPWLLGVFLVLVGSIIGIVVSADRTQALGLFKGFIVDPVLLAGLVLGTLDHDDLPTLLGWYVASAAVVSLISIIGWAAHAPWAAAADDGRLFGIYGIAANASPNYLAFWTAPAVAIGIAWLVTPPWPLKAWEKLLPLATLLSFVALVGSDSRAGIGAALIGAVIALALYYRSTLVELPYAQALGWLALIGLVAYGAAVVQPNFALSPATGGRITSSNNIRWEIWQTTGELMGKQTNWLTGVGLGSYQTKFGELTANRVNFPEFITPRAATPHNLWLNEWTNDGLLGLVGMTLLIMLALRSLWKAEPTVGATLVSALFLTILLQGLVDSPTWKNDTSALFWVALAASILAALPSRHQAKKARSV